MIEKIKNGIRRFFDLRVRLIMDQQYKNQQTNFCYNQIAQLFKGDIYIPFSTWTISPDVVMHVLNEITINKKNSVIEFGSGASTFYIAKLFKVLKIDGVFISVESDEKWANEIQNHLKLYKLEDQVKLIYAPLDKVPNGFSYKGQSSWYSINVLKDELKDIKHFDLILVDGPSGQSTPYARYSAIPFLKDRTTKDSVIFLDDALRPQEIEIAEEWKVQLDKNINFLGRYAVFSDQANFDSSPFQLTKLPLKN